MPIYNSKEYLRDAIESCLDQSFQDFELILINDNSQDGSLDIINFFQKKYPQKIKSFSFYENKGAASARNKGIELASGEYLVFADSDDVQDKYRLENVIEIFKTTDVDIVFNNCLMIDGEGKSLNKDLGFPLELNNQNSLLMALRRNYFYVGLSTVKKSDLIKFDVKLKHSEDYDLFLKLLYNGYNFKFINKPLTKYRIHMNNNSRDYQGSREATKKILSKYDIDQLYLKLQGHNDIKIFNTFGIMSLIKDEPKESIKFLKKAESFNDVNITDHIETNFYLGVAYFKLKDTKKSYLYFEKAYCLDQNRPAILNNLAVLIYLNNQNINKVKIMLEEALKIQPGYIDAQNNLHKLKIGEKPNKITENFLRRNLIHIDHYKNL
jgi:glycosyltransferase involved in cell wall biosynthesis